MIAYLRGEVALKNITTIVLDVAGVGYDIVVRDQDNQRLQVGDATQLYIHEHLREDAHDLYGFSQINTKSLFEQLLSVKNVGPKVAMAVLGIGSDDIVRGAIASGDVKLLQTAKGVGKRAAEQMIVELRDKVGLVTSSEAEGIVTRGGINVADEAVQGLMALGYSDVDAQQALESVDPTLSAEERIKLALKR
jgi:holliday junction DNA helicase RuvA